jgi:threonine/homoserine/homoserine lactone efflux protein
VQLEHIWRCDVSSALGEVLGYAVGIAVSPIPIAAVILMLFSARARSNGVAFMVAWVLGIALVTTVVLLIPGLEASDSEPSNLTGWIKAALGISLVLLAVRQWRSRPRSGDEPKTPRWMDRIDTIRFGGSFGLGFLLSALNPKNLLLAAAAGATISSIEMTTTETVTTVILFTLVAAATVVIPVVGYLVAGDRLDDPLDTAKTWLIDNNSTVMAVLLLVFGAVLVGDAIEILS